MSGFGRMLSAVGVSAAALALVALGCGQEKTAIGGGNPFHFEMDVSPESGSVGTVFQYEIDIDILRSGTTLEDLEVRLRVPESLQLVRVLGVGATLNGLPVFVAGQDEDADQTIYFFALGDVSEDPSEFRFQCLGVAAADNQFVFATLQAQGTTAPTVSRQVDID